MKPLGLLAGLRRRHNRGEVRCPIPASGRAVWRLVSAGIFLLQAFPRGNKDLSENFEMGTILINSKPAASRVSNFLVEQNC